RFVLRKVLPQLSNFTISHIVCVCSHIAVASRWCFSLTPGGSSNKELLLGRGQVGAGLQLLHSFNEQVEDSIGEFQREDISVTKSEDSLLSNSI
uniref:Uncharacterized protein n=1 Tax=Scophthalmus maximus TaxID=52904 RepID=A0A8D3A3Z6_SCOMX